MKKVTIYSPVKGGGSTMLATNLFNLAGHVFQEELAYVDCDLEFPGARLFFPSVLREEKPMKVFLPQIDRSTCIYCKACARACTFGAIRIESAVSWISLLQDKCRACGACLNTCRHGAITETEHTIGRIRIYGAGKKRTLLQGELDAQEFFSVHALQLLVKEVPGESLAFLDSRGGLEYDSLEAIHDAGLLVMVIDQPCWEPEYFSHVGQRISDMGVMLSAIFNRVSGPDQEMRSYCGEHGIPVLGEVPYLPGIPELSARAGLASDHLPGLNDTFLEILSGIKEILK